MDAVPVIGSIAMTPNVRRQPRPLAGVGWTPLLERVLLDAIPISHPKTQPVNMVINMNSSVANKE